MTEESRGRNRYVEEASSKLINRIDELIGGATLSRHVPTRLKRVYDANVSQAGSVRLAAAFFVAYATVCDNWDFDSVPTGIRGKHGDKRLAAALTERRVTFHHAITAFGENLGWKGNVKAARLSGDTRFHDLVTELSALPLDARELLLDHVAWRLFDSRKVPSAIPRLPNRYLTYARACLLCERLLAIGSQGHIQQLLVAGFLSVHRSRAGLTVKTHHPHAADKYDRTFGDIEEFAEDRLVMAYEITVRDDWKNRLLDLYAKASAGGLSKYILIASGVVSDNELYPAEALVNFASSLSFDLAVVDIQEFFRVFCAELTRDELIEAFNKAHELLQDPKLSGKHEYIDAYSECISDWIEDGSD